MRGQHVTGCSLPLPCPLLPTANLVLHSFPSTVQVVFPQFSASSDPTDPYSGVFSLREGCISALWCCKCVVTEHIWMELNLAGLRIVQICKIVTAFFLMSHAHGSWRNVNNIKWERSIFWDGWGIWLQFGQTPHGPFSFLGFTKASFGRGAVWNLLDILPFSIIYTKIRMYRRKYFISQ